MEIISKKIFQYGLAFSIPIILIMLICFASGLYPFGDKPYIFWDSDIQFVPFLGYFKSIFTSNTDFVYSFSKAGGNGMFDFNACYINNPLNFIAFLFPNNRLDIAFQTIVILKIALCGFSFSYFLNYNKKFEYKTLIFSTAYALSTCAVFYSQSIMGFEGMYILPLALVGIEKIVREQKSLFFILFSALTFLLEPYAGWVVFLFSFFYFLYFYAVNIPEKGKRKNIWKIYLLSCIFITGLSCAITLPTWIALTGTKYSIKFFPYYFVFDIKDIFYSFYTGFTSYSKFWNSNYPYVYSGILPFILFIAYFTNKNIKRTERLVTFLFIIFILATFSWHVLFAMFNGGISFPTGCIYRYVYIFIAIFLITGYKSLNNIHFLTKSSFFLILSIYTVITAYVYFVPTEGINRQIITFDYLFGLVCIFFLYLLSKKSSAVFMTILTVLCFGELFFNAFICLKLQENCMLSFPDEFRKNYDNFSSAIEYIKKKDKDLYRIETEETPFKQNFWVTRHRHNSSLLYNYPSISHYSSLGNINLKNFYSHIGFDCNFSNNVISYNDNLPLFPVSFMGIKYILSSKSRHINPYLPILSVEYAKKPLYLYENPYVLPLGFVSENEIITFDINKTDNVFDTYNILAKLITGKDFGDIYNISEVENIDYSDLKTIAKLRIPITNNEKYWITSSILGPLQYYFAIVNKTLTTNTNFTVLPVTEYLGELNAGNYAEVLALRFYPLKIPDAKFYVSNENIDLLKQYFDFIKDKSCNLEYISSSHLRGRFKTEKDYQVLVLTIPYDDNWIIKIDNKTVRQQKIIGALTGILIKNSGEHSIEMKYTVKGLKSGILISLLSFMFLFGYFINNKRQKKN